MNPANAHRPRSKRWPCAAHWAAAVVISSAVVFDPRGLLPFGPAKTGTVAVCTLLAAGITLRSPRLRMPAWFLTLWALFIGWLAISALASSDPLHAWIGTPDRRLGWAAWLLFALAAHTGMNLEPAAVRPLLRASSVASLALGAYTLLEAVGAAPAASTFAEGRLGGPYGQPAYLGAAAALLIPCAAGLAADRHTTKAWRLAGAVGALLGTTGLLMSGSRAAWVGLAAAATVSLPRLLKGAQTYRITATVVTVSGLIAVFATGAYQRALNTFTSGAEGVGSRVAEWQVAAAAITDAPIAGYGPEGYRIAFLQAVDEEYVHTYGRDVITDRAHSGVLDVATSGGIPAVLLYAALLGVLIVAAVRLIQRASVGAGAIAAGVLAYSVQQQFLFPVASIDPVYWLLAGFVLASASPSAPRPRHRSIAAGGTLVFVCAGVVAAAALLEVATGRLLAAGVGESAVFPAAALEHADTATQLRPDSIHTWYVASQIAARGPALTDVDRAIDRAEHGLARSPKDPALNEQRAELLAARALRSGLPNDLAVAIDASQALVAADPLHPAHRLRFADLLEAAGDIAAAAEQRRLATDLEKP